MTTLLGTNFTRAKRIGNWRVALFICTSLGVFIIYNFIISGGHINFIFYVIFIQFTISILQFILYYTYNTLAFTTQKIFMIRNICKGKRKDNISPQMQLRTYSWHMHFFVFLTVSLDAIFDCHFHYPLLYTIRFPSFRQQWPHQPEKRHKTRRTRRRRNHPTFLSRCPPPNPQFMLDGPV